MLEYFNSLLPNDFSIKANSCARLKIKGGTMETIKDLWKLAKAHKKISIAVVVVIALIIIAAI